jgi:hypothetical protein
LTVILGLAPQAIICRRFAAELRESDDSQLRKYRGLFTVVDDEIRLLHVRGAGQDLMTPGDIELFDGD